MLLLLAVFFLSSVGWMAALDPGRRISQYGHTAWRIQDGYFAGEAWSIAQTTDGYLWVGTAAGALRFDGVQFVPWASLVGESLPSSDIGIVFGARDGSLWIGTVSGLVHWVNQRSIRYLNGEVITAVKQDEKGQIWVTGTRSGGNTHPLCRIINSDVHCYGKDEGVTLSSLDSLVEDSSGNFGGDIKEADMDFILTGSRLENGTSSSIDHRLVSTETSRLTPVVYVVEPDEAERESLERLIECDGWHPETLASAEEFLAHRLEVVLSCLLLDVSLPGLSGLELQKRAALEHPEIAIIFLSAKGGIPIAVEAIKAGAVEFLTKPFSPGDFECLSRSPRSESQNSC